MEKTLEAMAKALVDLRGLVASLVSQVTSIADLTADNGVQIEAVQRQLKESDKALPADAEQKIMQILSGEAVSEPPVVKKQKPIYIRYGSRKPVEVFWEPNIGIMNGKGLLSGVTDLEKFLTTGVISHGLLSQLHKDGINPVNQKVREAIFPGEKIKELYAPNAMVLYNSNYSGINRITHVFNLKLVPAAKKGEFNLEFWFRGMKKGEVASGHGSQNIVIFRHLKTESDLIQCLWCLCSIMHTPDLKGRTKYGIKNTDMTFFPNGAYDAKNGKYLPTPKQEA